MSDSPPSKNPPPSSGVPTPPGPIMTQPQGNWMAAPATNPNCPPGLEYLTLIDQVLVQQTMEFFEALTSFETKNRYAIKNTLGQIVYFAVEENDCLTRNFCGPIRPFEMRIFDNYQNEILHLHRPLACQDCCYPCCLQTMEISSPPGQVIGKIEQDWSILIPKFRVLDAAGNTILRIKGPLIKSSCCGLNKPEFKLLSQDGESEVGKISKQWGGILREAFTDADNFGITFPMDLDVKMKAVMIGACFLIDFMYYEHNN